MSNIVSIKRKQDTARVQEYIEVFLNSLDVAEISRATYRNELNEFIRYLDKQNIVSPCKGDVLEYKHYITGRGLSSLTVSNYLASVKLFFKWTEKNGIYPNIAEDIKLPRRSRDVYYKDILSIEQARKFVQVLASDKTRVGLRNFALYNLMLRSALRVIEISRANVGDIHIKQRQTILYVQGKACSCKDQFIILTDATLGPIQEYLSTRDNIRDTEPLFVSHSNRNANGRMLPRSISRIGKECLEKAGINNPRITVHSLRHSAITYCLMNGGTLQEAKSLARHSSLSSTLIYAQNLDRFNNPVEQRIDELLNSK